MTDNSNSNSRSSTSSSVPSSREEESAIFRAIPVRSDEGLSLAPPPLQPRLSFQKQPQLISQKQSHPREVSFSALPQHHHQSQTSAAKSASSSWKVSAEDVPRVPVDYPLEQTTLSLDRQVSLDQITERISRVLEAQSLICRYDAAAAEDDGEDDMDCDERLPGRVDCTSQDKQLKFVVQVYRNQDEESYCVEMQRRRGSSLEFSAIRRPLFQTLQTGQVNKRSALTQWSSPPSAFTPNKRFRVMPCTPLSFPSCA